MYGDLAAGIDDPYEVARRHGYSDEEYDTLQQQSWFTKAVASKRRELEANGFTFAAKMGMLAEDLLIQAYVAAKNSESVSHKLDVAKYLTKIADLEPKQTAPGAGSGFSITINIPDRSQPGQTLELTASDASLPAAALPESDYNDLRAGIEDR
jgi:hypothetical protein